MAKKTHICAGCGNQVVPKKEKKGSVIIFIVLCFFMVIPGIIYLIWMLSGRKLQCPKCGNADVVIIESPRGKKLISEYSK